MTAPCFAFSKTGQRCMEEGGHDGLHRVVTRTEWSDDECWEPGGGPTALVPVLDLPMRQDKPRERRCFACDHHWHDDVCPRDCGCQTAVE